MSRISDYASLVQAISDFSHRGSSLTSYMDYFIQSGEDRVFRKILELNEGEGIRQMEAPFTINIDVLSGQAPVPTDFIALKDAALIADSFDSDLIVKEPQWIRSRYRNTQYQAPPAYIARDVGAAFVGSITAGVLTVTTQISGTIIAGQPLFGSNVPAGVSILSYTGTVGQWNLSGADSLSVSSATMTTGGFIFGPYPDSAYGVVGTYYQRSILTSANTVTWMTSEIPFALLEGCLASVSKFLKDPASEQAHMADMAELLEDIVLADKASRYAGGSLVISAV